jgi:hypothetical protein
MSVVCSELAVAMDCDACVANVRTTLQNINGISSIEISLENQTVVVNGLISLIFCFFFNLFISFFMYLLTILFVLFLYIPFFL